jgi:hypothetical protein
MRHADRSLSLLPSWLVSDTESFSSSGLARDTFEAGMVTRSGVDSSSDFIFFDVGESVKVRKVLQSHCYNFVVSNLQNCLILGRFLNFKMSVLNTKNSLENDIHLAISYCQDFLKKRYIRYIYYR